MRRREVIDCVSVLFDLIKIVEVDNFYMYIKLQRRLKPAGYKQKKEEMGLIYLFPKLERQ